MVLVSEQFVKNAQALAEGVAKLMDEQEKKAAVVADNKALLPLAEATADTLASQGLIPVAQKAAAVQELMNHEHAIQALNKTAQMVRAETMGAAVQKSANDTAAPQGGMRESDAVLLRRLGFSV